MQNNDAKKAAMTMGFLLVPDYSMIAMASAIEPLRMANRLSEKELYRWKIITFDGKPVHASSGLVMQPHHDVDGALPVDILFVCSGVHVDRVCDDKLVAWLGTLARRKIALGALCTASWILARAGLLRDYRCTIHWENLASMREEFPDSIVSSDLYEIDRDRYTCAGGNASMDMMLHIINKQHGARLAAQISEEFMCERIRGTNDRQRIPLRHHLGTNQPRLVEAVSLMEANLDEPMQLDELAHHVKLSRRQLERLFRKHLDDMPTRYYRELRLGRARQLLLQTNRSIADVGYACGFTSAQHFSKCYRDCFGFPPREERRRHFAVDGESKAPGG